MTRCAEQWAQIDEDMFETILIAVGAGFVGGIVGYFMGTYIMDKLR